MEPETLDKIIEALEKAAPIAAGIVSLVGLLESLLSDEELTDEQRAKVQAASNDIHDRFQATP